MLKKIVYFKACFGEILAKPTIFYENITLKLVILTQFQIKFGLYWPFFIFQDLKLLMTKFGPFNCCGPGNPD